MSGDFYGLSTGCLDNSYIRLEYLKLAGPRLVRLFAFGCKDNLFAEVPDRKRDTPFGEFRIRGGHRLWHAPEDIVRTYQPDNDGVIVTELNHGVRLEGPIEPQAHIQKTIEVQLVPDQPVIRVRHTLTNRGLWPVELAVWALSQMIPGGIAFFPQQKSALDSSGLLPNRQLVLWPYSSWNDPRLILADDFIMIQAERRLPPVKIGYINRQGWIGYLYHDILLVKRFDIFPDQKHADFGCNVESFCNNLFIEIETLGPMQVLSPGADLNHTETWEFYTRKGSSSDPDGVRNWLLELGLNKL